MRIDSRRVWVYLLVCLLTPPLWFIGALLIGGTDWFMLHDSYPALRNIGYSVRAHHLNCQVVVYGDSSALTGVDPRIVSRVTGLTACNVSEGLTIQNVAGSDAPLRAYLSQNEPPQIIVGMWSYTSLRPDIPPYHAYTTEGMVYADQYSSRAHLFMGVLSHPDWAMRYVNWASDSVELWYSDLIHGKQGHRADAKAERARNLGLYPFPFPPEKECGRNTTYDEIRARPDSVSAFRKKYTTPTTAVLVDISPIPDCSKYLDVYREKNEGLHDNPLLAVPIRYFNEGDVHFSPEGARFVSEQVGKQIAAALKQ